MLKSELVARRRLGLAPSAVEVGLLASSTPLAALGIPDRLVVV